MLFSVFCDRIVEMMSSRQKPEDVDKDEQIIRLTAENSSLKEKLDLFAGYAAKMVELRKF